MEERDMKITGGDPTMKDLAKENHRLSIENLQIKILKSSFKLFPVWFVVWLARKHCGVINVYGDIWAYAFDDVLVRVKRRRDEGNQCERRDKRDDNQ